jgi:acetyl esterase/lipase
LDDKIRPAVVFIHGGDLIHGDRTAANFFGPVYETSINSGNVLISIDYRLAPQTKLPEIVRDVEDAIDWVRRVGPKRFDVDPNQVVVMGSSSGAYLALVSGYRVTPPPKAIVSFAGSGDLVGDWYNTPLIDLKNQTRIYSKKEALESLDIEGPPVACRPWRICAPYVYYLEQNGLLVRAFSDWDPKVEPEKFYPYMPLKNVSPSFPPTVLVHGDADNLVPFEQAVMMAKELGQHNVPHELIKVKGGNHGLTNLKPEDIAGAYDRAVEFVMERLTNLYPI